MPAAGQKRQPDVKPSRPEVPHICTLEATGLIVIALLILFITLVRYWHHIPWGAR